MGCEERRGRERTGWTGFHIIWSKTSRGNLGYTHMAPKVEIFQPVNSSISIWARFLWSLMQQKLLLCLLPPHINWLECDGNEGRRRSRSLSAASFSLCPLCERAHMDVSRGDRCMRRTQTSPIPAVTITLAQTIADALGQCQHHHLFAIEYVSVSLY